MPTLPPPRAKKDEAAPAPTPAAEAPAAPAVIPPKRKGGLAVKAPASTSPEPKAEPVKPVKAAPPVKASKPPKGMPKAEKPTKPAKAPKAEKAVKPEKPAKTVQKKAGGPKAATAVVTEKVKPIKSRYYTDDEVNGMVLIDCLRRTVPVVPKSGRAEIRSVPARLTALLVEKLGLQPMRCYTRPEDTDKILKWVSRVPEELLPAKWVHAVERFKARSA